MPFAGGSGTEQDPYIITTVEALQAMKDDLTAHYALGSDIDASETETWNGGQGFEPIGTLIDMFGGSFDGRGYKITGLYINRGSTDHVGLFGYADGATIQNVDLVDGTIVGGNYTGGVVGYVSNGSVTQCYNTGSVTGKGSTGGVVGYVWQDNSVTQCYNTGSVMGERNTGGVVGYVSNGSVTECYNTGSVTGELSAGGVVGFTVGPVTQCYNTGSVNGQSRIGGVVGYVRQDNSVTQCYNTGSVNGQSLTGGVAGEVDGGSVTQCYWNTETSGVSTGVGSGPASGVFGKTTAEMMQQATYVGWDFDDVWTIDDGNGYPRLQWEPEDEGNPGQSISPLVVSSGVSNERASPLTVQATMSIPFESVTLTGVQDIAVIGQWSPLQARAGVQRTLNAPLAVVGTLTKRLRFPLDVSAIIGYVAPLSVDVKILHIYSAPMRVSSDVAGVTRAYPAVVSGGLLNQERLFPLVVGPGISKDGSSPLLITAAPKHRRRSPLVVEAGVRRRSRRPIDVIGLYWYRVPIPAPTYGGDD